MTVFSSSSWLQTQNDQYVYSSTGKWLVWICAFISCKAAASLSPDTSLKFNHRHWHELSWSSELVVADQAELLKSRRAVGWIRWSSKQWIRSVGIKCGINQPPVILSPRSHVGPASTVTLLDLETIRVFYEGLDIIRYGVVSIGDNIGNHYSKYVRLLLEQPVFNLRLYHK